MAYTYRNVKTNEIITTTNRVAGKNWEPVEEAKLPPVEDPPAEDPPAEDPPVEDPAEEDTVEETADEEAPAEKPKTSRRGKK